MNISTTKYPYLSLNFSSSPNAAILLSIILENQTKVWLTAFRTGEATAYGGNHYSSIDQTNLAYDLSGLHTTIRTLDIFATNAPFPTALSDVTVTISGLEFRPFIGQPSDYIRAITSLDSGSSPYVVVDQVASAELNKGGIPPVMAYNKRSPVEYSVEVKNATSPFLLVLGVTFDPLWHLVGPSAIESSTVMHLEVNGFANGWLITATGNFGVSIYYGPTGGFSMAYYASIIASLGLCAIVAISTRSGRRKIPQKVELR
jgi:hypothetical protein